MEGGDILALLLKDCTMHKEGLDRYDDMPRAMKAYLKNYGMHFNKKACDFAVSLMKRQNRNTGEMEKIQPYTKDMVEDLMRSQGVMLQHDVLYDKVYVANMCKADFLGSSVIDEARLVLYVRDVLDDGDANDGTVFNRWYADMVRNGEPIEWEDLL